MITVWILTDCKTGRFLRCGSEGQARRAAVQKGWVDYTIEERAA